MNIEKLKKIGGNEWIKNDYHRIYFNEELLCELYGLETNHYKTGNISSASLKDKPLSNSKARKIMNDLSMLKIWYDVKTGEFVFKCSMRLYGDVNEYFEAIVDAINTKIA
ncbi:MAG: hypothetical protein PVJ60_02705 [Phycisphaerales bacterium]|jgi:hypothetical protein